MKTLTSEREEFVELGKKSFGYIDDEEKNVGFEYHFQPNLDKII